MFKLKSDSPFAEFLRSTGGGIKLWGLIIIGVALIIIGSFGAGNKDSDALSTEERTAQMCSLMEGVGEC
ncbi:MAG: hypothetical protein J6V80_00930, partial [Clostridia bacterium]|nr:hypothetical protein [Clostridia bacterium]